MSRARISTTVDEELLAHARRIQPSTTAAKLFDAALRAFIAEHRGSERDAAYAVYEAEPLDAPDEWGDLASFRDAAGSS